MSRKDAIAALARVADARDPETAQAEILIARALVAPLQDEFGPLLQALEARVFEHFNSQRLAGTDPLTGVSNRRGFERALSREIARHERSGEDLAVLTLDLDDLKPLNDRHGHAAGDEALRAVAQCCEELLRKTDLVARLGGDEFAVLLPGADALIAAAVARRLRGAVEAITVCGHRLRISVGAAVVREGSEGLLARADEALYEDKLQRKGASGVRTRLAA